MQASSIRHFINLLLLICELINAALTASIDNELIGTPVVDCEDTMVSLTFRTKKPFTGRVYVRGLADDERCSRNFASNIDQSKFSMIIQNGDCTMQRQRVTGSLEGIMFSLTIVVSFHGTFITRMDRAYRCMCFFRNIKRLTSGIDMSSIGTTELMDTVRMPTCTYSIHLGSADGPPAVYGQVGEKIYHVWECDDDSQGFLVHSCFVNDGRGTRFDLLDVDGCAIDPIIQPDVQYEADMRRAVVETWGYKFSDTSVLNYQCVVELCKKNAGECEGLTPPTCTSHNRSRRSVTGNNSNAVLKENMHDASSDLRSDYTSLDSRSTHQMDLVATISMLDNIEENGIPDQPSRSLVQGLSNKLQNRILKFQYGSKNGMAVALVASQKICISYPVLTTFFFATSLVLTTLGTVLLFLCRRNR
uniref:ZP domain-containing protein n=1 Tax=Elaeophora elaphi TaxID=1147741 RepID=A0A0R3RRI3_9BILA